MIDVFTDGSAINNGQKNARGGIGIYCPNDERIILSQPFFLEPITNNRAEIYAIIKAIELIGILHPHEQIQVFSDSEYTIKSASGQYNGAKNPDLLSYLRYLTSIVPVKFTHVHSHKTEPKKDTPEHYLWYGNEVADRLAVKGSKDSINLKPMTTPKSSYKKYGKTKFNKQNNSSSTKSIKQYFSHGAQ